MNLWRQIRRNTATRGAGTFDLAQYAAALESGLWGRPTPTLGTKAELIERTFDGYASQLYQANPIVYACAAARMSLLSEATFKFRRLAKSGPGELFGTEALARLEEPWPGASTQDLLKRMAQDIDLAGNWFGLKAGENQLLRLRPDWVTIVLGGGGFGFLNSMPVGYVYTPGGPNSGQPSSFFDRKEIAHFAPTPDPAFPYRGMSWLTPVIRDVMGDQAATSHKLQYLENGATPNMVVTTDPSVGPETFAKFKELFSEEHLGLGNAYGTIFLGGGSDVEVIGSNMKDVDFKAIQAGGETRIAAAAGVPPILCGLTEGLESATYSNYASARRQFADGTARPLWRDACSSLAQIIAVPGGSELWYDDRDVAYLQEDMKDRSEVAATEAATIGTLIKDGFTADSAVEAVRSGDMSRLAHTGLVSVQLHDPNEKPEPPPQLDGMPDEMPKGNGKVPPQLLPAGKG